MKEAQGLSVSRSCKCVEFSRSAYYREPLDWDVRDADVIAALIALVEEHPRWGFWECTDRLRALVIREPQAYLSSVLCAEP